MEKVHQGTTQAMKGRSTQEHQLKLTESLENE